MSQVDLSLIIPTYKQEKTIGENIRRLKKVLEKLRYTSEIIVVVDGTSEDRSYQKATEVAKKLSGVKVVGYPANKGKGHAVRYGMAVSKGKIIAFIDAGEDIRPNGLSMMLEHFEWYKADIVIGSKRHPVSQVNYPWQRKILSYGYQILVRILFNLRVRDTQVGLKCYRREVVEKVLPRLVIKTYAFDIEILAVANYLGFNRIYEAPVNLTLEFGKDSNLTSKKLWYYIYYFLIDTFAVFYRLKLLHYYADSNSKNWIQDPVLTFPVTDK
jgi:glycosyltransferase involved in cell wall biosynthesis